jgi:hypothetical protein
MSGERLRAQCFPSDANCSYVRILVDDHLAANAFACRWRFNDKNVCWITQLVVDRDYRERGLAISLLNEIRRSDDDIFGVMSSHAAACLAAVKIYGSECNANNNVINSGLIAVDGITNVDLSFIRDNATAIMAQAPIEYIKNAKPHGSLFSPAEDDGSVSSADTAFFVDHAEPLEALQRVQENINWPLGDLIEGHEFLLIIKAKPRHRSKTRSPSLSA